MMLFYDRLPKTDVSFFMQADFPAPFIEIQTKRTQILPLHPHISTDIRLYSKS